MGTVIFILGAAIAIALIITAVVIKREFDKDERESIAKRSAVSRQLEEEAVNEALSYDEDEEDDDEEEDDDDEEDDE